MLLSWLTTNLFVGDNTNKEENGYERYEEEGREVSY